MVLFITVLFLAFRTKLEQEGGIPASRGARQEDPDGVVWGLSNCFKFLLFPGR